MVGYKGRVAGILSLKPLSTLSDPTEVGPRPAVALRLAVIVSIALLASAAVSLALHIAGIAPPLIPISLGLLGLSALSIAAGWRRLVGPLIDREVPSLLAYLLPYSPVASHIADLIVEAGRSGGFRWVRLEAERLWVLMRLGLDPERALQRLVETTPSRSLASALSDYIHAQKLGLPRSQLTLLLMRSALEAVRSSWESYYSLVRGLGELGVTVTVTAAVVVPVALLVSPGYAVAAAAVPIVAAPIFSLLMLAFRPQLGGSKPPTPLFITAYAAPIAVFALALTAGDTVALAAAAAAALAVEAAAMWHGAVESRALSMLKVAAGNAKYGLDYEEALRKAEPVAEGVVRSVLKASRIAGRSGVGEALDNMYRVFAEARIRAEALRGSAVMLALVTVIAPALAVYSVRLIAGLAVQAPELIPFTEEAAGRVVDLLVAGAPLVPMPAASMHRPWLPSLAPGLLSMVLALAALKAPLIV